MGTVVSSQLTELAIKHRRFLHQFPELSGHEFETYQYIKDILLKLNIEILDYQPPSIVGFLKGTKGLRTIALRADIDALPIMEQGEKSYISRRPGISHLCGHDGHTAILLVAATWLAQNRDKVEQNVVFIFQSSEEMSPSGAEALIKQGVLDQIDAIFGLHLWQSLPKGKIGVNHGSMMASADFFKITIEGVGGHGAMPHDTIDPVFISSQIVGGLQSIVSRKINPIHPAVITVGKIESEGTYNVIPSRAIMYGTIRSLSEEIRSFILKEIKQIVNGLCTGYGATAEIKYDLGGPPLINDKKMSQYAEETIIKTFGDDVVVHVEPNMGGEDFSSYLQHKPGAFIFLGMGGEKSAFPHHHPQFDIDEEVLPTGIDLFIQLVKNFK